MLDQSIGPATGRRSACSGPRACGVARSGRGTGSGRTCEIRFLRFSNQERIGVILIDVAPAPSKGHVAI